MRKTFRRAVVSIALTVPLMLGIGLGTAVAAPQSTLLQVPVVTGFQIAPGAVPGGLFQTIPMKATVGTEPGVLLLSAANIAPYADQYPYRSLGVTWRNWDIGFRGTVGLRHWQDNPNPGPPNDLPPLRAEQLPLEVALPTGSGWVEITVTHYREYYDSAPYADTLIPGKGLIYVP
ncbi:hypothetical protein QM588_18310 [Rhodococcus sp. IEGM 1354]|uniref:hypothetical protein n=1 Tax=Rhodococcus sp. IEGM 1354 TaxID=3047088 RepID=UPI0024B6455E|nr:hypothetical protein [Rhodococcus sp. IEGM 1354]MDI9932372.1 hypothetical protein [Rhodococcus sp. IEGM 1354]